MGWIRYQAPWLNNMDSSLHQVAKEMALAECPNMTPFSHWCKVLPKARDSIIARDGGKLIERHGRLEAWFPDEDHLVMFKLRWL